MKDTEKEKTTLARVYTKDAQFLRRMRARLEAQQDYKKDVSTAEAIKHIIKKYKEKYGEEP